MQFKKKVILTGSSGQLGQAFLEHLCNSNEDYYVYALDKKKIKGSAFIIILGINIPVKTIGVIKLTSIFLKNSNSSNKLKIIPKQKKTEININTVLR